LAATLIYAGVGFDRTFIDHTNFSDNLELHAPDPNPIAGNHGSFLMLLDPNTVDMSPTTRIEIGVARPDITRGDC
jgi:hypothetical protein